MSQKKIKELIDGGRRAGDIAILLRSVKDVGVIYEKELAALKITTNNSAAKNFFETPEILLMLSLLHCIDNPAKDIHLAAVLRSPLYGVTLEELCRIKREGGEDGLYSSLLKYTEKSDFEKGKYFLESMKKYREYAKSRPVDKLIWYIFRETGMLGMADNSAGENNLMLLYEYARSFESGSFKGLYNFIKYLSEILQSNTEINAAKNSEGDSDAVRIMTIHQSKGLEFPVCFLSSTGRAANNISKRENIILAPNVGIAMHLGDETGFGRINNPLKNIAFLDLNEVETDEEMRNIYVALTRAREELYITAVSNLKDPEAELLRFRLEGKNMTPATFFRKKRRVIEHIMYAFYASGKEDTADVSIVTADGFAKNETSDVQTQQKENFDSQKEEYKKLLSERFSYEYPERHLTKIPAKLVVSELYPKLLDSEDGALDMTRPKSADFKKPRFLEGEQKKATAAERGTATHAFMQFCDFGFIEKNGVKAELLRLTEQRFLSEETAKLVSVSAAERFFESELYRSMRDAAKLWREFRFNVKLPASLFGSGEKFKNEEVFVQGIIDCAYTSKDGEFVLVDYKTDSFTGKELENPAEVKKILAERHSGQLGYYRLACERVFGRLPDKVVIYSFALSDSFEISFGN